MEYGVIANATKCCIGFVSVEDDFSIAFGPK